jgi:hypothetical protein
MKQLDDICTEGALSSNLYEHEGRIFFVQTYHDVDCYPEGYECVTHLVNSATIPIEGTNKWYFNIEKWTRENPSLADDAPLVIKRLRAWLEDEWNYIGIVVNTGHATDSLWGIESDSGQEYFDTVILDLLNYCLEEEKEGEVK